MNLFTFILIFIVASIFLTLLWLIIYLFFKVKKDPMKKFESMNKIFRERNAINFVIDFNESGKLILKDTTNGVIIKNPRKEDLINILNNPNSKIFLPDGYVEITQIKTERGIEIRPTRELRTRNSNIFKSFMKCITRPSAGWALSKFI